MKKLKRYGYNADNETLLKIVKIIKSSDYIRTFWDFIVPNKDEVFDTLGLSTRQRTLFFLRTSYFFDETALSNKNFRDRYYIVNHILNYAKKKGIWTPLND
ncbi:hypothetical protein A6V39_05530 [Candidatus Mycoplasma haematobovis]|uniref:Uncharacterized protein n=1 Tax=Candidatus Mycoplasma haematobovis TaxID=432608 RepID=A0A1A9QB04_9MOLU|nr:hypothetical protein A6V39_05530 [Candidatus Mycoplasma haematobovis]